MEKNKKNYVQEPTFISLTDIHCRMIADNPNELTLNELRIIRENINNYRVESKKVAQKSR